MPQPSKIKVVRVPLIYKPIDYPQSFEYSPYMYLEFLENKEKIIPDLRNKDYVPQNGEQVVFIKNQKKIEPPKIEPPKEQTSPKIEPQKEQTSPKIEPPKNLNSRPPSKKIEQPPFSLSPEHSRVSKSKNVSVRSTERRQQLSLAELLQRKNTKDKTYDNMKENIIHQNEVENERIKNERREETPLSPKEPPSHSTPNIQNAQTISSSQNEKSSDLKDILNGDKSVEETKDEVKLPTFSEIESNTRSTSTVKFVNEKMVKDAEEINNIKRGYIYKFDLLRRSYKGYDIPIFTEYSDLEQMKKSYDDTLKRLQLDSSIENYRKILLYIFAGIELMVGYTNLVDMKGFTKQQILYMNDYEKLLVELGEKSHFNFTQNWSPEMRLVFLIIINTATFAISKFSVDKFGINIISLITGVTDLKKQAQTPSSQPQTSSQPSIPQKMKGPSINMNDL